MQQFGKNGRNAAIRCGRESNMWLHSKRTLSSLFLSQKAERLKFFFRECTQSQDSPQCWRFKLLEVRRKNKS